MGNFAASATTSSLQDRLQRAHRTGVLTLCSLGLQGLPKNVGQELSDPLSTLAPLIRSLDLSRNKITAMPAELQQLTQLKILNLAHNKLKFIDSECQLCHKLEVRTVLSDC
jgi:hypothetical protein